MKKAIFLAVFLPILAFAANEVEIGGVSLNIGSQIATVNGNSVYDTSTQTDVAFNSNSAQSTGDTSWTFSNKVHPGKNTVSAVNGDVNASLSFVMPSNEGTVFQGLGALSGPQIPDQKNPVSTKTNNIAKDGTLVTIHNLFELIAKGLI